MKSGLLSLLATIAFLGALATTRADSDITFKDFYDALTPDGDWVEVEDYGYCWRPFVDDNWSPYTDGQWVYTDAGYTWFSNEPWGWAVYHYGRWTKVKNWGWVWVPGYEWGPAWVSWRTNDDYIGWAPLPPEAAWDPGVGFTSYVDIDYGIGPDWYSFCPVTYFCAPRLRSVCVPWRNNITIIANTVNITRIRNVNNVIIFNDGPDITMINRRADTPLRRVKLEREGNVNVAELRAGRIRSRLEGDTLKIPAPKVIRQENRPDQIAGRAGGGQINRGWEAAEKNPQTAQELRQFRDKLAGEAKKTGRKMAAVELADTSSQTPPPLQNRQPGAPAPNTVPPPPATPTVKERVRDRMDTPPSQEENTRNEQLRDRIMQQRKDQKQDQQQQQQQAEQRRQEQREVIRQQLEERRQQQENQESQQAARRQAQQESQQRQQQQEAESQPQSSRRQQQQSDDSQELSRRQQAQQQLQQQIQQQQQQQQQEKEQRRQAAAQAAEAARQKAAEARARQEQAQQDAAERQQQQDSARQQQQEQQRQQIQQQIQQQRQERQQQRQDRRQGN